jgi:hypothetical protein
MTRVRVMRSVNFVEDLTTNLEMKQPLTMAVEFVLQIGLEMSWWLGLASR